MKKIIKIFLAGFFLMTVSVSCGSENNRTKHINGTEECEAHRCKGKTQEGKRCKNETKNCNGYCHVHQDQQ